MKQRYVCLTALIGFTALVSAPARLSASVVDVGPAGFLIQNDASVKAPRDRVYAALVSVGSWWNPAHTYSHDSRNLTLDVLPGGCFCEKLANGGGVRHMSVVYVSPPTALRMAGALGPLQESGLAGSLTWKLSDADGGTRLEVSYSVGGYMRGGFDKIAPVVDSVIREQLLRLKSFVETGKPDGSDR